MRRELTRFVRTVAMRYHATILETEEQRATVLAKMMERYENPPITFEDGVARADLGYVPVGFSQWRGAWRLAGSSPLLENSQPQSVHVARQLLRLREAHPEARELRLEAREMRGQSLVPFEAFWRPGDDMVWVVRGADHLRTVLPVGPNLEAILNGSVSLAEGMHRCSITEGHHDPLCH